MHWIGGGPPNDLARANGHRVNPDKKRLNAVNRRQKILDVAASQFLRDGYDGCTLDRVAAAAKVGKQAIYQFFDGKEHLFAEVVRATLALYPSVDLPLDRPFEEVIDLYLTDMVTRSQLPDNYGVLRNNILAYRHFPDLAAELHAGRRRGATNMARYLEALAAAGRIQPLEMDSLDLATRLYGLVTDGARHFLGFRGDENPASADMAHWVLDLFLHGCRCESCPQQAEEAVMPAPAAAPAARPLTTRLAQDRFDQLCDAALEAFLKQDFDRMSLDELVAGTGVSRATIYRQFGSKEGLFRFVVSREIDRLEGQHFHVELSQDLASGLQELAEQVLERHLGQRSIAMHHLLIRDVERVPDLARRFYETRVESLRPPLAALYRQHRGAELCTRCLIGFYTLATFGVRFLTSSPTIGAQARRELSAQVVRLMVRGFASSSSNSGPFGAAALG